MSTLSIGFVLLPVLILALGAYGFARGMLPLKNPVVVQILRVTSVALMIVAAWLRTRAGR